MSVGPDRGIPVLINLNLPALVSAFVLFAAPAMADPPPQMGIPRAVVGVWVGERMHCQAPRHLMHTYGRTQTYHPSIFDDEPGYRCSVVNVRGHQPNYRVRLQCVSFGKEVERRRRPVMQTIELQEAGQRMQIRMWDTSNGDPLREEHLFRCR